MGNPKIADIERITQNRVVKFFEETLDYKYLGNWEKRKNNSNIEEHYLKEFLVTQKGYSEEISKKAISELRKISEDQQKSLYDINKEVYSMLRYGKDVKIHPGQPSTHVHFIDWTNTKGNYFAIAEEVSIEGKHDKRPDIVIYVNGIALGVLELKRSKQSISKGIRQNLDNQKKEFIRSFFGTQQLVMAGNDSQGLMYGTIETPEKYYQTWKEENLEYDHNSNIGLSRTLAREYCDVSDNILDSDLYRLLNKERFLEIIHDYIVFDAGIKKLARHNQYFGIRASQERLNIREGGIFWHTQGSGKSLSMVWLAKWIRENIDDSRILIITDRTELDEQIETTFKGVNEIIYRTKSGKDLLNTLNLKEQSLIASLVHKFGRKEEKTDEGYNDYIKEIRKNLPRNFEAKGDLYVFVDECHRTQSGKLHKAMKEILPSAVFIGFTGTPLLKKDKQTTHETFGSFIHTYKYDEAVSDKVVLDLRYEARDIDLYLTSQAKIDTWFEAKTRGLSVVAKSELKKRWGTMQKVVSSRSKLEKIVTDILFDFETKPRLEEGRGNAMLVAGSIYEACKYYEMFISHGFMKCAIVTSYKPHIGNIKGESDGEDQLSEDIKKYDIYRKMIANYFHITEEEAEQDRYIEDFEKQVKKKFVDEPGQMKLLIVVDKLLTGFDAPSATYLYIDKSMKDHGLFQAVCRVNRLDEKDKGDELDKDYGYIIDYKDLFKSVEQVISDYTGGAFDDYEASDVSGLLKNRLEEGKNKLDEVIELVKALTEGVSVPRGTNEYRQYFVGDNIKAKEQLRLEFYKAVSSLVRAYTNIANEMIEAGYTIKEEQQIKNDVKHYCNVRDEVKMMSSDYLDLHRFNPAMRHLIDSYIQADESRKISAFEDTSLLEMIILKGIDAGIEELPKAIGKNKEAVAETIENNIRKLVTDEREVNPAYYEKMSFILDELVEKRRIVAIEYEEYLIEIEKLIKNLQAKESLEHQYPLEIKKCNARIALYDNLNKDEELSIILDKKIRYVKKDNWRGNIVKRRQVRNAINRILEDDELTDMIYNLVEKQVEY
ncbi:MAG: HsdR family type I site-specific deoxyribonuclease [Marinifilaceae bacterium]